MAVLVLLGLLAMIGVLVGVAFNQDRAAQAQSRYYADRAVQLLQANQARVALDYSNWLDVYEHLHKTTDTRWAYDQLNLGRNLLERFSLDGVFVVRPDGRTSYAVIDGALSDTPIERWLEGDLQPLLEAARRPEHDGESFSGIVEVGGQPGFASLAAINTDGLAAERVPGPPSVLVLVDTLDDAALEALGQSLGVAGLRLPRDAEDAAREPSLPLTEDGRLRLRWDPPQPGRAMLGQVLPIVLGVAALFLLVTGRLLSSALGSARSLEASEARFRDIAESATDWLWESDARGRIHYLSNRFAEVTGQAPDAWVGRRLAELLRPQRGSVEEWLDHLDSRSSRAERSLLCEYDGHDGRPRVCRLTGRLADDGGYRGTASDITDEIEAKARIEHLAQHDPLTGLANRNQLGEFLDLVVREEGSRLQRFALLCIDLDRFKPVNDALGHAAGDMLLREVARRLQHQSRKADLIARVGGDEFILVIAGWQEQAEVDGVCRRLVECLAEPFSLQQQDVHIGASIGIACYPHDSTSAEDLLRFADLALYQAKSAGRSTWRFYASDMNERILQRRQIEQELRAAIRQGQLRLHFQPRYQVTPKHLRGVEALVRWEHPERGLVGPDRFIGLAEETGLIVPLGQWVLHEACREVARWPEPVVVSVNLSCRQFSHPTLVEDVARALDDSGLPGERLELEITESVMIQDADGALDVMQRLKALGVRLSMDDFGTGFSSLSYLRRYPFDGLKIDRSFIADMGRSSNDRSIVQAIINLGRSMGLEVTAEGVETPDQMALLEQDRCDEVQGYLLSRPLPAEVLFGQLFPGRQRA